MWVFLLALHFCLADNLQDIKHIVIFMQENRAFDHYYGSLRGVRGFNDRSTITLPTNKPVWFQSVNTTYDELPWHMDTLTTSGTCASAPRMDYPTDIGMWNQGLFDRWNSFRDPGFGMSYFLRPDLEFYYSLADAFTICDQYHQSSFTQTNPNRLHLFSGSNGLSAGYPPVLDNEEPTPGWKWKTFAETLEESGISWRVYQESDNFDDNGFEWFASFQQAQPGSPLYDKGVAVVPDIVQAFKEDVEQNKLPQVSWLIAPEPLSEHANNRPAYGEDLSARLLAVLGNNPQVYKNTMFILNYDEQGGFFDHIPPPTPPVSDADGKSTVTTVGEITGFGSPVGLGFRVPMILISPWTTGGYVSSELFDHTSVIKFVERRFGVHCPNISPWRRAVVGDILNAIDFKNPNYTWPTLPDTSDYVPKANKECQTLPPPHVPSVQRLPVQEKGTKPSRALPYIFNVQGTLNLVNRTFDLSFSSVGKSAGVFQVYTLHDPSTPPRKYTVESMKSISDEWPLSTGVYQFSVHSGNGYLRQFFGSYDPKQRTPGPMVTLQYKKLKPISVVLSFNNTDSTPNTFLITDPSYPNPGPWKVVVPANSVYKKEFVVADHGNWYDFQVTTPSGSSAFLQRFKGRVENGLDSISDPAMAGLW